jgi:ligand-binding sensor domain-containing protein
MKLISKILYILFILFAISCKKETASAWIPFPHTSGIAITGIAVDGFDNVWVSTYDTCILMQHNGLWTADTFPNLNNGKINSNGTAIAIDQNNNKWVGTNANGIWVLDINNHWTQMNTTNSGLINDSISCISIDTRNNKWIGTNRSGISKFDGNTWTSFTTNNGLINNAITAISIDSRGNEWFGTWGGVSEFNGTAWKNYTVANGLTYNFVATLAVDPQNNVWVACAGYSNGVLGEWSHYGILKYDGKYWTLYNPAEDYDYILSIAFDDRGDKWFGTDNGICRFDGINWFEYNSNNSSLKGAYYPAIAIDKQQHVWAGTMSGIGGIWEFQ